MEDPLAAAVDNIRRDLRTAESQLNLARHGLGELLSSFQGDLQNGAYQLDEGMRSILDALSETVRVAGVLAFDIERGGRDGGRRPLGGAP